MKRRFLALAALFVLALGGLVGCSNGGKSSEESSFASTLYAAKNPYLENTSANNDLVSLIGLKSLGKYTLAVQDDARPYTLQIRFMYLDNRAGVIQANLSSSKAPSAWIISTKPTPPM